MTQATQKYSNYKIDIEEQIKELTSRLERHAKSQAKDPNNWGYTGDLANVTSNLHDILNYFGVRDYSDVPEDESQWGRNK